MIRLAVNGRMLGVLAALPLLSGCIAVAALPLMAGGAMFAGGNVKIRSATKRPKVAASLTPATSSRITDEQTAGMALPPGGLVTLTTLTALPPPDAVRDAADPWKLFASYAVEHAASFVAAREGRGVLLETGTQLELPRMRSCASKVPAVVIDLDEGTNAFAPRQGLAAQPGLAERLAEMRATGAAILWITSLPASRVGEVADALRQSGLDPAGIDPLLLARSSADRKQVLREEANRDVCIIAIAGDRKGDFDELFDYLRDQGSGQSLDYMLGAGWFLVPPPL